MREKDQSGMKSEDQTCMYAYLVHHYLVTVANRLTDGPFSLLVYASHFLGKGSFQLATNKLMKKTWSR